MIKSGPTSLDHVHPTTSVGNDGFDFPTTIRQRTQLLSNPADFLPPRALPFQLQCSLLHMVPDAL